MDWRLVYVLIFLWFAYYVAKKVEYAYKSRSNGCKPVASINRKFLGMDLVYKYYKATVEFRTNQYLADLVKHYGKRTIKIDSPLEKGIFTIEPENIKAILATNFESFGLGSIRHDNFAELLGDGIFTLDGQGWSLSRSLLRPQFARDRISDLELFEHHFQNMIKLIPSDGSTVDMQELFFRLTIDAATEFLFGESIYNLLDDKDNFATSFNFGQEILARRVAFGDKYWLYRPPQFVDACKHVHSHIRPYVERAIAISQGKKTETNEKNDFDEQEKKYVFLDHLAKETKDPKQLQDQLINILLAGRDTTASLLSWTVWVLSTRPDVFEKLRNEVIETCGIQPPDYTQMRSMKYMRSVLNEVLRLWPIVPNNMRMALRDTQLPLGGGPDEKSPIFIPKGSSVNYSVYLMQRDKKWYGEDADVFDPERWFRWVPEGWTYLPFNGGPRICLGQQFALNEASYTIIRLLQHYEKIENRQPEGVGEQLSLTMACRGGVHVGMIPAKDM